MTLQEMQKKVDATSEEYKKVYQDFVNTRHDIALLKEKEKTLDEQLRNMRGAYAGYVEAMRDFMPNVVVQAQELPIPGKEEVPNGPDSPKGPEKPEAPQAQEAVTAEA